MKRLRRRVHARTGVEYVRTTCAIFGRMVPVFEALCFLEHRKPYQLVADIVLEHLRAMESDPVVRRIMALHPSVSERHLTVVEG